MEIRFNIELTEREREKLEELQRASDRTAPQFTKALLYTVLNRSAGGSIYIHSMGAVRNNPDDPS